MKTFLHILHDRNLPLYYFGLTCFACALLSILLVFTTNQEVLGINAWIKPFKFFTSSVIFSWTMGWIMFHLNTQRPVKIYSWVIIVVMTFELTYICWKAASGELSHFNLTSAFNATMFSLMGVAIAIMTSWTAYIGWLFFRKIKAGLPNAYVWGMRLGILLFVIFAFEGFIMGANLAHTIGALDGSEGLPVINWSTKYGDLRVAHFFGMHALQIIPLISYYFLKKVWAIVLFVVIYFGIVSFLLMQALLGNPVLAL